ncbi:MAG: HD domain-containing protein [Armatimonadota bacterium]
MSGRDEGGSGAVCDRLVSAMKETFGDDARRIAHALKVLEYAREICAGEGGSRLVVEAAAVLHDIGIQEAERKHGSSAGRYQEIEGPPIARRLMEEAGLAEETIEHVCRIVGSHHSASDIDTREFRIVWDADWLVNIPEEFPHHSRDDLRKLIGRVFRTRTGREMASAMFLGGT